jgi:beta-lactamase class D
MFVLYDLKLRKYIFYNPSLFRQPVQPASTFNILLALIGLTEGVIQNEQSRLTDNDTIHTQINVQKNDFTLENAFTHNLDSFFIKLSLRVGERKIKYWVNKINYGNKSVLGEKGRFWINGALVITPEQQLNFIKDFYYEKFPFPKQAYKVVKKLMQESVVPVPGSLVYGKRGSNKIYKSNNFYKEDKYTGWYIGYIVSPDNVYFFTNYIESPDVNHPLLVNAQKEIAFKIFKILLPAVFQFQWQR